MRKRLVSCLMAFVFAISLMFPLTVSDTTVFADDNNSLTTLFEKETTQKDKEYVKNRDKLIKKHGIDEVYEFLGK